MGHNDGLKMKWHEYDGVAHLFLSFKFEGTPLRRPRISTSRVISRKKVLESKLKTWERIIQPRRLFHA
jgi:hypothetical protein